MDCVICILDGRVETNQVLRISVKCGLDSCADMVLIQLHEQLVQYDCGVAKSFCNVKFKVLYLSLIYNPPTFSLPSNMTL